MYYRPGEEWSPEDQIEIKWIKSFWDLIQDLSDILQYLHLIKVLHNLWSIQHVKSKFIKN